MTQKLLDLVLYAGLKKEYFTNILPEMRESTRRSLSVFTLLVAAATTILAAASFFLDNLVTNRCYYFYVAVFTLLLYLLAQTVMKRHPAFVNVGLYLFMAVLYAFGIVMGTFVAPDQMTVSFIVLLFAVPLIFSDRPLNMGLANLLAIVIYVICAKNTQSTQMFTYNMTNILTYGSLSIICGSYTMRIKAERFAYEQRTRFLSESDQLTGMLNRRSYEQHISRYREKGSSEGLTICAFDVNGLKTVNDTLGHKAGDELIKGAADCLEAVFGPYGKCYRVGGDEFMAILTGEGPTESELIDMLCSRTRSWKGMLVSGMSISLGIVRGTRDMTVDEAAGLADQKMYFYKAEYYRKSGRDRRQRRSSDEERRTS